MLLAVLFTLVALLAAACSSSSSSPAAAGSASAAGKVTGTVVVFAATSLTEAFNKIGDQFEPGRAGQLRVRTACVTGMEEQKQPFNPLLAVLAALAALFFVFPLIGMITGAPWGNVFGIITSKSSLDALGLSLIASLASTVIALLFGFPLAWLLARGQFRGQGLVRALTTLPMVLPPVVGGIALLLAYGRRGFIGQPLDKAFGISLPFTLAGVIVAESFVAMPFFVITVESGLRSMNRRLEDAARSLGAKRLTVFRRVTLPPRSSPPWARPPSAALSHSPRR